MFSGLIGSLFAKFEKSELYTFLVGCAVALTYVLRFLHDCLFDAIKNYYSIYLFLFMFLLFTGVVYLFYYLFALLLANIIALLLTPKHRLGSFLRKRLIEKNKKESVRYLPALSQYSELQHLVFLITSGLILIIPNLDFIVTAYFQSSFYIYIYYFFIIIGLFLSFYTMFIICVFEICYQDGCFEVTDDKDYFLNKLNESRTQKNKQ